MRRTCMKWKTLKLFTLFATLLLMTSASAHAQNEIINVPFDFTVGDTTLPAGDYVAKRQRIESDTIWVLQSKDGHASALFMTQPVTSGKIQNSTKFIFNSYGSRYFLSEIWIKGNNSGRELAMRRHERELRNNLVARRLVVSHRAAGKK